MCYFQRAWINDAIFEWFRCFLFSYFEIGEINHLKNRLWAIPFPSISSDQTRNYVEPYSTIVTTSVLYITGMNDRENFNI